MKKLIMFVFALLLAGSMAFAQENTAEVNQNGKDQESRVQQDGGFQDVLINQAGEKNESNVKQFTDNQGVQTAEVNQNGDGNKATVDQKQTGGGNATLNTAYISQAGKNNEIVQIQNAPGYNGGQHVNGYQEGNGNFLKQQTPSGHTLTLNAHQYGKDNDARQTTTGAHNTGDVEQHGSDNKAVQLLSGSNNGYMGAVMMIKQMGSDNYARQDFIGHGSSHANNGIMEQSGSDNEAWQNGDGRDLDAQLFQNGVDNWSKQMITGEKHYSIVTQNGRLNKSTVIQSGVAPVATIN